MESAPVLEACSGVARRSCSGVQTGAGTGNGSIDGCADRLGVTTGVRGKREEDWRDPLGKVLRVTRNAPIYQPWSATPTIAPHGRPPGKGVSPPTAGQRSQHHKETPEESGGRTPSRTSVAAALRRYSLWLVNSCPRSLRAS